MSELKWNGDFWEVEKYMPLFSNNTKIYINREDESFPVERQLKILKNLEVLNPNLNADIKKNAISYFDEVSMHVNLGVEGILIDRLDIEKNYRVKNILIPEIFDCEVDYFFIICDCDWDQEHGMEMLIGDNKVLSCGANRGMAFNPAWEDLVESPSNEHKKHLLEMLNI